jgi:nucleoside-diphosphate kinase
MCGDRITNNGEGTLVIIKPDGIKKSLTGNILTRLSESKLKIIACKMMRVDRELAEEHYKHLRDKAFFDDLIQYIMGKHHTNRVMALVYYGENAIRKVRDICGATNPEEADPSSIRGGYGRITTKGVFENVLHASENSADSEREIKLWFKPDDLTIMDIYPSKEVSVTQTVRYWA